jgi:hypothetical protein
LDGHSKTYVAARGQKLGPKPIEMLSNEPMNNRPIQTNTPLACGISRMALAP